MNELGIGLVYFQGFENFLASHSSLIDVVEIEPQTFWYDKNDECDAFKYDADVMSFLGSYDRPKLFHGVGYPIGGTCIPPAQHFNTLRQQVNELKPQWISEHLSFNMFNDAGREINSGFLLPPLQTAEGVKIAAANIRHYQDEMGLPFAFETGANYLKPRKNEIPDGLFVRKVAEEADCHILLDLHNILVNQRNGRQSIREFLKCLPYERVIELHVGGGIYYKDYYLDAHSGPSDAELFSILEEVAGKLPNLKALMFEIDPESFTKVPQAAIRNQLNTMRQIWDKRGYYHRKRKMKPANCPEQCVNEAINVSDWEYTLGKMVLGKVVDNALSKELIHDKGIAIIKDMVFNFRGSVLISTLKFSTRLLRLSVGEALFNTYVNEFFDTAAPELLPIVAAEQFSAYIKSNQIAVPYLGKVLEYELASIHTAIDKQKRTVNFDFDPAPLFAALQCARMPSEPLVAKALNLQVVFENPETTAGTFTFNPVVHN
ncbi:DUF692 family multinuclear iron-containing protein [Mucilaginibacter sp.]|uniref:DUF692 domain-containing protein n=1 Tax=Mucilaginibacter sp. TaxID=1882438 RepID=UPI0028522C02|nr:DUF692 family multinuclear iron-containing protein [Mucilaginibacter sp.]MDR3695522.1 DUF692 family protein [Mucilaginibacter sp.]